MPLHLKQKTLPPIILILIEGEGDGMESRLPFKIFSILHMEIEEKLVETEKKMQICKEFCSIAMHCVGYLK